MANAVKGVIASVKGAPVKVETILVPDPGPGEVMVRVQACGVCHTDLHYREGAINNDYHGPTDGRGMSQRSLRARGSGRVPPFLENPWIRQTRQGDYLDVYQLMQLLAAREETDWRVGNQPAPTDPVFLVESNYQGFNLFNYDRHWYGLRTQDGFPKTARTS